MLSSPSLRGAARRPTKTAQTNGDEAQDSRLRSGVTKRISETLRKLKAARSWRVRSAVRERPLDLSFVLRPKLKVVGG